MLATGCPKGRVNCGRETPWCVTAATGIITSRCLFHPTCVCWLGIDTSTSSSHFVGRKRISTAWLQIISFNLAHK
jgi:hypothetical protein